MSVNKELPEEQQFSDDPEENLRLENQFLQMKLSAERGGVFGGNLSDLPPEIMNEWLKNVEAFEKGYENSKELTVREILENPEFNDESLLNDSDFETEYLRLHNLMEEKNILVHFSRERDDRFKYRFITKELFDHITEFVPGSQMTTNFIYEEFHPDHELDIQNKTEDFFSAFFERRMGESAEYVLGTEILEPDGSVIPVDQVAKRFEAMYEAIPEFKNPSYEIEKIDFELKDEEDSSLSGMGYSEGIVKYDMVFSDGRTKEINGPFKIYFSLRWDYWSVCFFLLAGFNLKPPPKER